MTQLMHSVADEILKHVIANVLALIDGWENQLNVDLATALTEVNSRCCACPHNAQVTNVIA
jgi:hypothetical protein